MNAIAQASAAPVSGSKLDNRRVLAALIDLVVVGAGAAVILAAAGVLGGSASEIGAPLVLVALGWALYYYFACESGNGQTLGKRAMKLRVVRTDGQPAGMREIGVRTVLRVIDMQFAYLVGLGVMLATGERRGRLGDLAGATMIVAADQPAAIAPAAPVAEPASRVPIGESGPAFAPVPEDEPDQDEPQVASPALQELAADVSAVTSAPDRVVEEEPAADEPAPEADVSAVTSAPDRVVEEEPAADEPAPEAVDASEEGAANEPASEESASEEPASEEAASDEPASEEPASDEAASDEPAATAEADEVEADEPEPVVEVLDEEDDAAEDEDEAVNVRSVETISAIDLVMDDSRRES